MGAAAAGGLHLRKLQKLLGRRAASGGRQGLAPPAGCRAVHRSDMRRAESELPTVESIFESLTVQESSVLARLRHPCVVQLLAVCADPPALVSEYCARGSLADVLHAAAESPQAAAQLGWPRRLGMVSLGSVPVYGG